MESTIIDCTSSASRILRPGAFTGVMINEVTGLEAVENLAPANIRVSGSLENHYAPKANLILTQKPSVGSGFISLEKSGCSKPEIPRFCPQTLILYLSLLRFHARPCFH